MVNSTIKNKFNYVEPKVIISTVIALLIIILALFIVGNIKIAQDNYYVSEYEGVFGITDPSSDQRCDTNEYGMTGITVTLFYNDGTSRTITTSDYSYSGDIVTVDEEVIPG